MKKGMVALIVVAALTVAGAAAYRYFAARQAEGSALPGIPADAALLSLDWVQTGGESADGSFVFVLMAEDGAYTLSDGADSIPLSSAQWRQVEQALRAAEHRAPVQLPEGVEVLDATESTLTVTWQRTDSKTITAVYDGSYESELRQLLFGFLTAEP